MSNDQEDYEQSDFIVADDDDAYLDVVMENLSNMITPKDSGNQPGRPLRPFSPPTSIHTFIHPPSTSSFVHPPSTTSSSSVTAKISPLVTDMETVQIMEPETSVRAVDGNNNPIYATSQTPYGFQAMTKRKTSKKSIFNFENIDTTDEKGESRDEGPNSGASMAMDTPSDSPISVQRKFLRAKPRGSATEKVVSVNVAALAVETDQKATTPPAVPVATGTGKPKSLYAFDSMDETALKSAAMGFNDEKEYLEALKWNGLSPHVPSQQLPPVPTPKNPRKKADTRSDEESLLQQQQEEQQRQMLYLQQQQQQLQQQQQQQQLAMNYGSQSASQPYMGYYSQPSSIPTAYPTAPTIPINTSDALRASWMNSTQSSSASQPGNDLASQLQYYSGDISQLQLPSIRNAPPAVIPETYSYGFPFGQNPVDAANSNNNFTAPGATPGPTDLPLQGLPNPANITEIMNYQALLQRKMDELKQQAAGYDSSHNAGYYGGANRSYTAASASAQADSDNEDAGTVGKAGSRASKSLSEISKRFVTIYGRDNTLDYIAGKVNPLDVSDVPSSFHRVDAAAEQLGVHVRRIYELIKILEILSLVQFAGDKRGKFSWRGNKDFLRTLGEIQEDGLRAFPLMAAQSGLLQFGNRSPAKPASLHNEMSMDSPGKLAGLSLRGALFLMDGGSNNSFDLLNLTEEDEQELSLTSPSVTGKSPGSAPVPSTASNGSAAAQPQEEQFMVEIICKKFLQLFLVGMNYMSMSNAIQKLIPMEENQSLTDYNRVNATKIRRVYDVTNVLCSLNLIRKQTISRKAAHDAEVYNNIDIQGTASMSSPVAVTTHPVTAANNGSGTPASGNGKKTGGKANGNGGDRVDAKVLEWTSFNPAVIREQYLLMCRK